MKKIISMLVVFVMLSVNALADIYIYFVGYTKPDCLRVFIVFTQWNGGTEYYQGSGFADVGAGCEGRNLETESGSPVSIEQLMMIYPETTTELNHFYREYIKSHPQ